LSSKGWARRQSAFATPGWGHSGCDGDPAAVRNNVKVITPYLGERLSKRLGRHEIA
jgi:hypothetical protein